MKMILGAIALTLAVPALAQTAPAQEPKQDCCEKMNGKECCCKDMAGKDHKRHETKQDHAPKDDGGHGHDGHAH